MPKPMPKPKPMPHVCACMCPQPRSPPSWSMSAAPKDPVDSTPADQAQTKPVYAVNKNRSRAPSSDNRSRSAAVATTASAPDLKSTATAIVLPNACMGEAGFASASITSQKEIILVSVLVDFPHVVIPSTFCKGDDYVTVCNSHKKCIIALAFICGKYKFI
jgi:hypothetical protein